MIIYNPFLSLHDTIEARDRLKCHLSIIRKMEEKDANLENGFKCIR